MSNRAQRRAAQQEARRSLKAMGIAPDPSTPAHLFTGGETWEFYHGGPDGCGGPAGRYREWGNTSYCLGCDSFVPRADVRRRQRELIGADVDA